MQISGLQYEVSLWVNWRIFLFHSLGKSELSPLLASQIRVFLTDNEKASYLSRQHILFTAYGGPHDTVHKHNSVMLSTECQKQATGIAKQQPCYHLLLHTTLHPLLKAASEQ